MPGSPQRGPQKLSAPVSPDAGPPLQPHARYYDFDGFRIDVQRRRLLRGEAPLPIKPKALETLLILVEERGHVVDKGELMSRLWPDTAVEEANLTQNIFVIRKALGEEPGEQKYIATVARHGYRFVAEVREVTDEDAAVASGAPRAARPRLPAARGLRLALLGGALVASGVAIVATWDRGPTGGSASPIRALAVLPFKNLSADPEQAYFSDGMTEAVAARLSQVRALRVVSRGAVMAYEATPKAPAEIARQLGVEGLVDGSVELAGGLVRITVELIEGGSGRKLWSGTYEADAAQALGLHSRVAEDVVREIGVQLTAHERLRVTRVHTVGPAALEAYLKGRHHLKQRTGLKTALEHFNRAIELDPSFAPAYSGLADAHIALGGNEILPPNDAFARAKAAATRALELDDELGEAHSSLATTLTFLDWDWAGAEQEFRRALELSPSHAPAHHEYAEYLTAVGRLPEAIREAERAVELDPLSQVARHHLGFVLSMARAPDQALDALRKAEAVAAPNVVPTTIVIELALVYARSGRTSEAASILEGALARPERERIGPKARLLAPLAHVYATAGREAEALRLLQQLKAGRHSGESYTLPITFAKVYAALGERDEALRWLERAHESHVWWMIFVNTSPDFDPVREDPRFQELVKRMGLAS